MAAIGTALTSLPFTQLRKNRYFYLQYDGFYAVVCALALAAMVLGHYHAPVETWDPRVLLLLPLVCHLQILCSVWIHNCTHNNFPRPVNRLIGEICGLVVLTRFASWEVIHQRHHRYSDDVEKDPHPVGPSYWRFLIATIVNVETQLQQIYFDLYGDTPENRRYEKLRAYVSYATNILLIATWYKLLGPICFFVLFVPASIVGFLHLVHFNWSTHNAFSAKKDFKPVNLDHGYYKVGNLIWHGIYMHANHHKKANLFNPAKMSNGLPLTIPGAESPESQA